MILAIRVMRGGVHRRIWVCDIIIIEEGVRVHIVEVILRFVEVVPLSIHRIIHATTSEATIIAISIVVIATVIAVCVDLLNLVEFLFVLESLLLLLLLLLNS